MLRKSYNLRNSESPRGACGILLTSQAAPLTNIRTKTKHWGWLLDNYIAYIHHTMGLELSFTIS